MERIYNHQPEHVKLVIKDVIHVQVPLSVLYVLKAIMHIIKFVMLVLNNVMIVFQNQVVLVVP